MSFEEERAPQRDAGTSDDEPLRCKACGHAITERAYRTERSGAHEHTFVNPGGFMHTLGCFVAAPGCSYQGEPETAFSWFPGWSWQIAVCARCHVHLGWIFRSQPLADSGHGSSSFGRNHGEQFHGLVLAALT